MPVESVTAGFVTVLAALIAGLDPALSVAATGAGAAAAPLLSRLFEACRDRRSRNVGVALLQGAESSGTPLQTLVKASTSDAFREQLTADVIEAASRSAYHDKIAALGRAWATGVLTEEDADLAREQLFVRSVTLLELPHIRVLRVVEGPFSNATAGQGIALVDGWVVEAVRKALPEYHVLVDQLIAVLSSEGLIADNAIQNPVTPGRQFQITLAGRDVLQRLEEVGNNGSDS